MYKVIQALIILHNIFLMIGDNAREIPDFDGADADAEAIEAELGAHANGAQDLFSSLQVLQARETADSLRRDGWRLWRDILRNIE